MALTPKFQAVIKIWETVSDSITIEFARPADTDVLTELQALTSYNGFSVEIERDSYTRIKFPPTYDAYDVAREVEDILRRHQFQSLRFIVHSAKRKEKELSTMAEVK